MATASAFQIWKYCVDAEATIWRRHGGTFQDTCDWGQKNGALYIQLWWFWGTVPTWVTWMQHSWLFAQTWVQAEQSPHSWPKPPFYHHKRRHWVKISYFFALQIVVKLLQSKSTKSANLSARFSESWGTADPPPPLTGAHRLAWIASPEDLIHWKYKKKIFPSAAKQRTVSVHSLAAGVRRMRVCIHLSLCCDLRLLSHPRVCGHVRSITRCGLVCVFSAPVRLYFRGCLLAIVLLSAPTLNSP